MPLNPLGTGDFLVTTRVDRPVNDIGFFHRLLVFLLGFSPFFSIAATNIFLVILFLLWVADLVRKKTSISIHHTPFDLVLVCYLSVWFLAGLVGYSPIESLKKAVNFQHPLLFYFLLFSYGGRLIPSVLCGLGVGAGLNVLYGWGQFILWEGVYDFKGGEIPAWFQRLSFYWQKVISLSPKDNRIHGSLHLMTYSHLLLPPFFFMGALLLEKKEKILMCLVGFLLSGAALVFAAERGPILAGGIGLLFIFVIHPRRVRLLVPMLFILSLVFIYPASRIKMGDIFDAQRFKENHRLAIWKGGLYVFSRHPLLGVGPGQIKRAVEHYKDESDFPPNPKGQAGDLHNYYLQRLAEMGIPGLVVSCWLLWVLLENGNNCFRKRNSVAQAFPEWAPETINALSLCFFASFLSFLFVNITERAFDDAEVSLVFWMMAAASVWLVRQSNRVRLSV